MKIKGDLKLKRLGRESAVFVMDNLEGDIINRTDVYLKSCVLPDDYTPLKYDITADYVFTVSAELKKTKEVKEVEKKRETRKKRKK